LTRRDNLVTILYPTAFSGASRTQNSQPYRSTWLTPPINLIDTERGRLHSQPAQAEPL